MTVIATLIAESTDNTARRVFEVREGKLTGIFSVREVGVDGYHTFDTINQALVFAAEAVGRALGD